MAKMRAQDRKEEPLRSKRCIFGFPIGKEAGNPSKARMHGAFQNLALPSVFFELFFQFSASPMTAAQLTHSHWFRTLLPLPDCLLRVEVEHGNSPAAVVERAQMTTR